MKYILMEDDRPISIHNSSVEAMNIVESQIKKYSWFTTDMYPPKHTLRIPKWTIYGISEGKE